MDSETLREETETDENDSKRKNVEMEKVETTENEILVENEVLDENEILDPRSEIFVGMS